MCFKWYIEWRERSQLRCIHTANIKCIINNKQQGRESATFSCLDIRPCSSQSHSSRQAKIKKQESKDENERRETETQFVLASINVIIALSTVKYRIIYRIMSMNEREPFCIFVLNDKLRTGATKNNQTKHEGQSNEITAQWLPKYPLNLGSHISSIKMNACWDKAHGICKRQQKSNMTTQNILNIFT